MSRPCLATCAITMPNRRRDMPTTETRNEKLDLRLTPSAKRTLQIAAQAAQRSVSEFVLESALARAGETLPDRRRFGLSAEQWAAFQAVLDAPPRPAPRLSQLLRELSVFERGRKNEPSH
ncbi:MAG: DUF1778 domain-containing protein [Bryobacteraceae bacterium]